MGAVPNSEQVYYRDKYWNDHELVLEYLKRLIACGNQQHPEWWPQHIFRHYLNQKPRPKALFLNCGNGWVERELYDLGCFVEATAFDYSDTLLQEAEKLKGERKITYLQADCNKVTFPENEFDLVFNVAALHHVQLLNRMLRTLLHALKPDGLFISFDYVGAHRNQYDHALWSDMQYVNMLLPAQFQKNPLPYPHLETMLSSDPTEAIHSELILEFFERYFYTLERKDLNGAIAYQIMHNNHALFTDHPLAQSTVKFLIEMDELYSSIGERPALFSFWVGQPKKSVLNRSELLQKWENEEQSREERAAQNGGRYY